MPAGIEHGSLLQENSLADGLVVLLESGVRETALAQRTLGQIDIFVVSDVSVGGLFTCEGAQFERQVLSVLVKSYFGDRFIDTFDDFWSLPDDFYRGLMHCLLASQNFSRQAFESQV